MKSEPMDSQRVLAAPQAPSSPFEPILSKLGSFPLQCCLIEPQIRRLRPLGTKGFWTMVLHQRRPGKKECISSQGLLKKEEVLIAPSLLTSKINFSALWYSTLSSVKSLHKRSRRLFFPPLQAGVSGWAGYPTPFLWTWMAYLAHTCPHTPSYAPLLRYYSSIILL